MVPYEIKNIILYTKNLKLTKNLNFIMIPILRFNFSIAKIVQAINVERQSKDLGSNPSAVESVFFSTERFSNTLNICHKFKIF